MKHLLILLLSCSIYAQKLRPLAGVSFNLHVDFKEKFLLNLETGAEYKLFKFLYPEVRVSYLLGTIEGSHQQDISGKSITYNNKTLGALNYSFSPKIILGAGGDNAFNLQIAVKYNVTKIDVSSYQYDNTVTPVINEDKTVKLTQHSVGFSVGYCFNFEGKRDNSVALNLYYNGIDFGPALQQLNPNTSITTTKDILGAGLVFYYDWKKNKEN